MQRKKTFVVAALAWTALAGTAYYVYRKRKRKVDICATPETDIETIAVLADKVCKGQPVLRLRRRNQESDITIFVKTFGCQHNTADSEMMCGLLAEAGYSITTDLIKNPQVAVINSCTVKSPSQEAMMTLIKKCIESGIKVVLTGCVPQAAKEDEKIQNYSQVGPFQLGRIVEVVEETLNGNIVQLLDEGPLPSLETIPRIRRNELIEVLPISSGCLGYCTYCKTRQARGSLKSYRIESILERIGLAIKDGVQQIWLTSEDTGAYGLDIGSNIAILLREVQTKVSDDVMVRLGMTNPPYIKAHVETVCDILNSGKFFKFIHIPVQSGSDPVLTKMRREYTVGEFESLCDYLLENVPDITIATDIICGFPGETDEDHQETLKLIKKYKFPVVNISQFYPRPGTPAFRMKKVPSHIVKARSSEVAELFRSYSTFDKYVGLDVDVWFDAEEEHEGRPKQAVGHTLSYIKVIILEPYPAHIKGAKKKCSYKSC